MVSDGKTGVNPVPLRGSAALPRLAPRHTSTAQKRSNTPLGHNSPTMPYAASALPRLATNMNDPTAGSPTVTLLRLLLPLDNEA